MTDERGAGHRRQARTLLLAALATVAFLGIVFVALLRPEELATFSALVAGIGTLALALMTVESVRTAAATVELLGLERVPAAGVFVGEGQLFSSSSPTPTIDVGVMNIGQVPVQDVRLELLEPAKWVKLIAGTSTICETALLPVGGKVVGFSIILVMSARAEAYPPARIRLTWWDAEHGTHVGRETHIDVRPFVSRRV